MLYEDNQYNFRIILAGDLGVGKTNLVGRYTYNEFNFDTSSTIGAQYSTKSLTIDNRSVVCQIWDTAGQEKSQSITKMYYREAVGTLVVYDICDKKTFKNVEKWIDTIREIADQDVVIILVGNKLDLIESRVIKSEDAHIFAQKHNIEFFETSALTGENVELTFENLCKKIYYLKKEKSFHVGSSFQYQNEGNSKPIIKLKKVEIQKQRKCC